VEKVVRAGAIAQGWRAGKLEGWKAEGWKAEGWKAEGCKAEGCKAEGCKAEGCKVRWLKDNAGRTKVREKSRLLISWSPDLL
jgi:hypothetical protein